MPRAKLIAGALALGFLAAGCQQANTALDRTIGPGASTSSLTPADAEFVLRAADSSNAEIALGELAQQNASSASVKEFGADMVTSHTRLNEMLASVATARGLTPPTTPTAPAQAVAAALGTRTGTAFDRAYLEQQVASHDMTRALFRHAARNADEASIRTFAQRHVSEIEEHLERAERLQRSTTVASN